ncbi:MDR family MFS transporter [Streptomyces sp. WSLK1-5]|uniref:MDR family MFS transporter n=1 Tax=unclassified Streptomyces TaxID=2593676 RepID=UPI00163B232B|nr:MFS transporter [Streptomyces sp. RP5T]
MKRRSAQQGGGLPRTFWWLWGGTLITSAGGFVVPYLAIYLTSVRDYSVSFTGLVMTVFGIGSGLAAFVGGILADRLGRRAVLLWSEALSVIGMAGLGFADTKVLVVAGTLVVGVGLNATRPARAAAVADLVSEEDRPRAYSLLYWATNLGFSVAAVSAGAAADQSFALLFLVNAIANTVAGAVAYRFVPETRPESARPHRERAGGRGSAVLRDRPFTVLLGSVLLLGLMFQQPLVALPLTMTEQGRSPAEYGLVMMVNGLVIAAFQLPLSRLGDRFRPEHALAVATLFSGIGFGLTGVVQSLPGYAATVVLWSLGEIVVLPRCMTLVALLAPAHAQGSYQGRLLLVWSSAVALAPLLSSQLIEASGTTAVWVACTALGLLAAALHLVLGRLRRKPVHEEAEPLPS